MPLAQLTIDLVAKVATFENDLKRVATAAEEQSGRMARALDLAKTGFAGLAGAISVGAITTFVRTTNDAVDALNDVSDATGASIESISALEGVARRTGANLDLVGGVLVKFNQALADTNPNSPAAQALQAIGLSAEELRRIDPAQALQRTAQALQAFADDGNKARVVQELFGRSVREAAPFLKDLAEAGELVATVTAEQAAEADKFNKELFRFQTLVDDLNRGAVSRFVQSINEAADAFRRGREEGKGFLEIGWDRYKANIREFYATDPAERLLAVNREIDQVLRNQASARADNRGRFDQRLAELRAEKESLEEIGRLRRRTTLAQEPEDRPTLNLPTPSANSIGYIQEQLTSLRRLREAATIGSEEFKRLSAEIARYDAQLKALNGGTSDGAKAIEREAEARRREELRVGELRNQIAGERRREEQKILKGMDDLVGDILQKEERRLQVLLDATPTAQLERQRQEMQLLADALTDGLITAEQFNEAAATRLGLVADQTKKATSFAEEFGLTFTSAFEDAIVRGGDFRDVLAGIEQDLLRILIRKQITEPLGDFISSGGIGEFFSSLFPVQTIDILGDGVYGGARANGGPVSSGKTYLVGERGPELFTPTLSGSITPNHALGGVTINVINQSGGGMGVVGQRQRTNPDGSLTVDVIVDVVEAAMADRVGAGSGSLSRALEGRFGLRPSLT